MKVIHKHDLPSAAARHRRECDGAADIAGADDAKLYGLRQRALPRTLERINCVTFVFFGDSTSTFQVGHLALSRSPIAASRASATTFAWSNAVNLPPRRRTRPSTITVSTFVGIASETIAS